MQSVTSVAQLKPEAQQIINRILADVISRRAKEQEEVKREA